MTDDEIEAIVNRLMAIPGDEQVMAIRALIESLPPERQQVVRESLRTMVESD